MIEMSASHPSSTASRAIAIPLHSHGSGSQQSGEQASYRRVTQGRRAMQVETADSDIGSSSGSSVESEWASSPAAALRSADQHLQTAVASPSNLPTLTTSSSRHQRKDKQRADSNTSPPNTLSPLFASPSSSLGPWMLSSSSYKSINLNTHYDPESKEPARLITYTKHSQGFTWNDELFLPSYLLGRHRYRGHGGSAARRRWTSNGDDYDDEIGSFEEEGDRCPVTDIFVTDEEAAAMMP